MKKIIMLLMVSAFTCCYVHAQSDTLKLKNGKTIAGYIFKMKDDKISIASGGDTTVYKADDVAAIMFCHKTNGSGSSYSKSDESYSKSSYSYSGNPCDNDDTGKAKVTFQCNMCGGEGMLEIKGKNGNSKTTEKCSFTLDEGENYFEHVAKLYPGEYTWTYHDTNKNATSGKLTIIKGEDKKIVLFEKE